MDALETFYESIAPLGDPFYDDKGGRVVYCGDCRELLPLLPEGCVDLVLTDPPYPKEFDSVWDRFKEVAPVMRDDSYCVSFLGHYQLPRVMDALRSAGLTYEWIATLPNNNQPIMHGFKVKCCWKPAVIFRKGRPVANRIWFDNFWLRTQTRGWKKSQSVHKWGQSASLLFEPIDAFSAESNTVLDPFLGGGTTLEVCKDFGRYGIGIEISEEYCETAKQRLRQKTFEW